MINNNKIISTICCTLKAFLKHIDKVWGYKNEQRRRKKIDKLEVGILKYGKV